MEVDYLREILVNTNNDIYCNRISDIFLNMYNMQQHFEIVLSCSVR